MVNGICDYDSKLCNGDSTVCRLNPEAGEQNDYDYANPQVRMPLRNSKCSRFTKVET